MKTATNPKSRLLVSLVLLAAVILSACSQPTTPPPPTATPEPPTEVPAPTAVPIDYSALPFIGQTWYWVGSQFNDDTKTVVTDPSLYSIQFAADGSLSGQADCNRFTGIYTVEGNNITIAPGAMTLAACPPESQATDFLQQLPEVGSFLMQDGSLFLEFKFDSGTMQFSEEPVAAVSAPMYADQPFVGMVWQWLRFDSSDGSVTVVPNPPVYTIEFLADGSLQGMADCNSFGGSYTVEGASLQIQMGATTLMACPEGSMADQFTQRLGETATYVIENGVLYLNMALDSGNMVMGEEPIAILPEPAPGQPAATSTANVNVRSGPSTDFPVFGVMPFGRTAEVIGKNEDGSWWALNLPVAPMGQGWVSGDFVTTTGAENVPVLPAPPVPAVTEFTPPGPDDPQLLAIDTVYVRSGPSDQYPAYGVAPAGSTGLIIGRSQDGLYWVVRINPSLVSSGFGWVSRVNTVDENVPNLQDIPVIEAPPLPPAAAIPAPPAGTASGVTMTAVNLRSGPGTNYPVLAVAPMGAVGEITGKSADGGWWQVRVPTTVSADGFAWVSADWVYAFNTQNVPVVNPPVAVVTPQPTTGVYPTSPPLSTAPPSGQVKVGTTTDTVNLRAGPGNQYPSLGVLPAGSSGVIVDESGNYYAFKVPTSLASDGKGWVSSAYIKVSTVNYATATAMATPVNLFPPADATVTGTPNPNATSKPPVTNACKIIEKKPADGTVYKPNFEFDMKAVLQNTGTGDWDPNAVDVKFVSALANVPTHTGPDSFDLPELVKPNNQIALYVDQVAPAQEGTYGETWAVVQGGNTLCQWSFTFHGEEAVTEGKRFDPRIETSVNVLHRP